MKASTAAVTPNAPAMLQAIVAAEASLRMALRAWSVRSMIGLACSSLEALWALTPKPTPTAAVTSVAAPMLKNTHLGVPVAGVRSISTVRESPSASERDQVKSA